MSRFKRSGSFLVVYLIATIFIVPIIAEFAGRVPLPLTKSGNLIPHTIITPILNRHYVKPQLKSQLYDISHKINSGNVNLKVSYLDANFPFIDGFPLLPHLSHKDGKKVDLSFFYTKDGKEGILKPTNSGYGKFVEPLLGEFNQTNDCKKRGYWHYDYTKFLTLGSRGDLKFDSRHTKYLVDLIVSDPLTQKLLIEPHIKLRMRVINDKIRFQGCHAVRHDDHIHYQIN